MCPPKDRKSKSFYYDGLDANINSVDNKDNEEKFKMIGGSNKAGAFLDGNKTNGIKDSFSNETNLNETHTNGRLTTDDVSNNGKKNEASACFHLNEDSLSSDKDTRKYGIIEKDTQHATTRDRFKASKNNLKMVKEDIIYPKKYKLRDDNTTPLEASVAGFTEENRNTCIYWDASEVCLNKNKVVQNDAMKEKELKGILRHSNHGRKHSTDKIEEKRCKGNPTQNKTDISFNPSLVCSSEKKPEACAYVDAYEDSLNNNETNYGRIEKDVKNISRVIDINDRDQKQAFSEVPNLKHEEDYALQDFDIELEESHSNKRIKKDSKMERHFVHHDYHDHSCDQQTQFCSSLKNMKHKPNNNRGGVSVPFPLKLHIMLEQVVNEGLDNIVSWQAHGRCFVVHRPKDFVEFVMPKYFRQTKLTSFQRQLNLYAFCRLTRGKDAGGYYHELFLRDKSFLCRFMTRTKIKGTGTKAASSPDSEPNFYTMPSIDSLAVQNYRDFQASNGMDDEAEPTKKKYEHCPSCNEEKSDRTDTRTSSSLPNKRKGKSKMVKKKNEDASRERLWNRPFYYMESLSFTKNRLNSVKHNERIDTGAKGKRNCMKNTTDSSRNNSKPLVNRQEDQDSSWDLLWRTSSLPLFDNLLENDNYDPLCFDDDLNLGCILDKEVS